MCVVIIFVLGLVIIEIARETGWIKVSDEDKTIFASPATDNASPSALGDMVGRFEPSMLTNDDCGLLVI